MDTARSMPKRGAHNQALIREVNERIEAIAARAAPPEFLCECADERCIETIELSIAEYEAIRSSPLRFPVKPGHRYSEFERVVEEHDPTSSWRSSARRGGSRRSSIRGRGLERFRIPRQGTRKRVKDEEDLRAERLQRLRRTIAAEGAETDGKTLVLHVLDEMVLELAEDQD